MDLLTPEKIKNDTETVIAERRKNALAAAEEEAQINQRLNDARDEEDRQKALKDLEIKEKITPLEAYLVDLRNEVVELEERKAKSLEPIIDRETKVVSRETACTEQEADLFERKIALERAENQFKGRAENQADKQNELEDREEKVTVREAEVAKTEDENKRTALALSDKWVEFNEMTARQKEWMSEKEAEVDAVKKANAIKTEEQRLKDIDFETREVALTDKYGTMVAAARQWESEHPDAPPLLTEEEKSHD